ncbi:hypothetical protein IJH97_01040, partial [Candidatus Saccharibacteria bacterium]|nr:hypothetical protein [Candidatus Saccharibacteria bacterium]
DQSEDESTAKYTLPDTGPVDDKTIDDFLYYYNEQLDRVNDIETPYSSEPLSNESLVIPVELAIPEDVD